MQQHMLQHFAQLLGFNMDPTNNPVPMQQQQLLQVAPDNRFFVPLDDNNKAHEPIKAAFEKK